MIAIQITDPTRYNKKDRPTIIKAARGIESRLNDLDPAEQTEALSRVERALETRAPDASHADLINTLTGGRTYTPIEIVELETRVLTASFARRRELLKDAITAPQVAKLLGTSRQTPHDRVESGTLLGVQDRGAWYFPLWQFDAEGPDGVVAGLPMALKALDVSPLAKVSWLTRANQHLEGASPLDVLKRGDVARIIALAEAVGVN